MIKNSRKMLSKIYFSKTEFLLLFWWFLLFLDDVAVHWRWRDQIPWFLPLPFIIFLSFRFSHQFMILFFLSHSWFTCHNFWIPSNINWILILVEKLLSTSCPLLINLEVCRCGYYLYLVKHGFSLVAKNKAPVKVTPYK